MFLKVLNRLLSPSAFSEKLAEQDIVSISSSALKKRSNSELDLFCDMTVFRGSSLERVFD